MQIGYKKEEFLPLMSRLELALSNVQAKLDELHAALKKRIGARLEEDDKRHWLIRALGGCGGSDFQSFSLQCEIAERQERRDTLRRAIAACELAMKSNAERVVLSADECRLVEMYTR